MCICKKGVTQWPSNIFFRAVKIHQELGIKNSIAINFGNIGIAYMQREDYPKALQYYSKALRINQELGRKSGIAANLGNLHANLGDFTMAEKLLHEAVTLSRQLGLKENLRDQYKYLSDLYSSSGKPAEAFEGYKQFIIYRDSIHNEENTRAQTRTEVKYEYDKAEMVKAHDEKEALRIEAEATSRRNNLQYSVVLICLLLVGVVLAMLGRLSLPARMAEGIIFFSFLILFEFLLVLADPYIENWSGGAPGIKLLFNAGIAALIFPLHSLFETKLGGW